MLKKLSFLSVTFALFCTQQSFAVTERFPFFSDVSPDHYQFSAITKLLHDGVINGYSDGTFQPEKSVSRAETLKILLEGSDIATAKPYSNPFADVPKNEWFAKYVNTAKQKNIVKGDGQSNLFKPARTVNKAEAVKMLLEMNNEKILKKSTDTAWYDGYFRKAIELGIIKDENNAQYLLTRGDLAGLMYLYNTDKNNIFIEKSPENLEIQYTHGNIEISWTNNNIDSFTLIAQQNRTIETVSVGSDASIVLTHNFWKNFTKGEVLLTLKGDNEILFQKKIVVYKRFTPHLSADISEKNISWEYEDTISVSLNTENILENAKGYILNTNEELFEKTIQNNGQNISLSFNPSKKDLYIFELADNNGSAKAIIPISPKGYYPILPNNLDSISKSSGNISSIIKKINVLRKKHGRKPLSEKQNLTSLAQVRATDMKERNYFSHYNLEGKSSDDLRSDYSIESSVMENIAMHSKGIMNATIGLEYSPTHRNILLSDEISFVGIGIEERENGEHILVELFQTTPLSKTDITNGNDIIYDFIQKEYSTKQYDTTLEKVAKEWSEIMAKNNEANTDFGNGVNWKTILDKHQIEGDTAIFVLSHSSPKEIKNYLVKNDSDLLTLFSGKNSYGLSMSLSKEGLVYLCIVSNKK